MQTLHSQALRLLRTRKSPRRLPGTDLRKRVPRHTADTHQRDSVGAHMSGSFGPEDEYLNADPAYHRTVVEAHAAGVDGTCITCGTPGPCQYYTMSHAIIRGYVLLGSPDVVDEGTGAQAPPV